MKFDKARDLVKLLLAMCIVFCIAGIITNGSQTGVITAMLSVVFFVAAFVVISLYCKCPNCGKRIYLGLFKAVNCPRCKRNLITGAKSKGKKR
jgi:hypothetical protein